MNKSAENKKVIIVCNTLFQIMVATHLRLSEYKNYDVDLVISNHTNGGNDIAKNAEKTKLFGNVLFVKNRKTVKKGNNIIQKISYTFCRFFEILNNIVIVSKISKNRKYDIVAVANISIFTVLLFNKFLNKNSAKLHIFEEGLSTYCKSYTDSDKPSSLHRKFVNKNGILAYAEKLFVFNKNLVEWELPKGQIVEIQKFNANNVDFVNAINIIFNIKNINDKYDRKIIFFEESFAADGFKVNDIEIVNKIAQVAGKENIMVKMHPRSKQNRFAPLGYETNTNTNIPWEVIVLNQNLSDKILVTISSGSVIYPYLYFGINLKSYSLLNLLTTKPGHMNGELGEMMNKIYNLYPDAYIAPKSEQEFTEKLQKLLNK